MLQTALKVGYKIKFIKGCNHVDGVCKYVCMYVAVLSGCSLTF